MAIKLPELKQHTRQTFVKPAVKEIDITTKIIDAVFNYYPKECYCLAGYLDNSDQFWKVNYHFDLLASKLDEFFEIEGLDDKFYRAATAIENALYQNTPTPLTGYRLDKQVGQTKDNSSEAQIIARHKIIKQSKIDFESVLTKSKVVTASKKSNPPKDEKMWWLAVAPLAAPGTSKHGTGYALDIGGNNLETTRISKELGASLVFNEASHVHVEFKNWKDLI